MNKLHHAVFETDTENLILEFHIHPQGQVMVSLSHFPEHLIKIQVSVGITLISLDPLDEGVLPLHVFVDARSLKNCVEGFLGVRLYDMLLMRHHLYNVFQKSKITESLAH